MQFSRTGGHKAQCPPRPVSPAVGVWGRTEKSAKTHNKRISRGGSGGTSGHRLSACLIRPVCTDVQALPVTVPSRGGVPEVGDRNHTCEEPPSEGRCGIVENSRDLVSPSRCAKPEGAPPCLLVPTLAGCPEGCSSVFPELGQAFEVEQQLRVRATRGACVLCLLDCSVIQGTPIQPDQRSRSHSETRPVSADSVRCLGLCGCCR